MASLPVYNRQGEQVGNYEIDPAEFASRINKQLLHDAVVMYQANRRQGTAKTKTRSEVVGSTQKMYRQKGTGRARAGSRRTNIRRGGGRVRRPGRRPTLRAARPRRRPTSPRSCSCVSRQKRHRLIFRSVQLQDRGGGNGVSGSW